MSGPVDLLLISWNRRSYLEKALASLLSQPAQFRLYCWDNASEDGAADIIASIDDPRVVERRFSKENRVQDEPFRWFLGLTSSDVAGKVDDDRLLPHGWIEQIAPMIRDDNQFGMLGCWSFMPEDWDEAKAINIIQCGETRLVRSTHLGGASFLCRTDRLREYLMAPGEAYGMPVDRYRMSLDGWISGYPLPLLVAHNMDDPRSPHFVLGDDGRLPARGALTARHLGFESTTDYAVWIAADAHYQLTTPFKTQLKRIRLRRDQSWLGRLRRKIRRIASYAWSGR